METESVGVFVDSLDGHDQTQLSILLNNIRNRYSAKDYILFNDFFTVNNIYHWGVLPTFYLKFFRGKIIFLDQNDYVKYKDNTLAECIIDNGE
jgi:hypothetical protein